MHFELPLLVNIALALAYALIGGLIARRIGLPTIVGYLLAGVALGPFTPGFTGDPEAIHQLAELGVILLMFGVGLHFSLRDLWEVRNIAVPGAIAQMGIATALGYWMATSWGWSSSSAFVLGIAISVASTVVLLRGLIDLGELETSHGRVAVGWLVFEDLATVVILVVLPAFALPGSEDAWTAPLWAIAKAGAFVALMLLIGNRAIGAMLGRVAHTGSRELFVVLGLTAALGTALASATIFGVSLALGAFVAGVVVSESPFSHQVGADLLPFRETFAVLFFVSVGMLVNPSYLITHWQQVAALTALVVVGKSVTAAVIGFLCPYPARTALIVAAGLSQIGEFSFIVGQAGVALGLLDNEQYSLILAVAILSITLNPGMFRLIDPIERLLRRTAVWVYLDRHGPEPPKPVESMTDHAVIIGCGRVGRHVAEMLGRAGVPRLVIESDPGRLTRLQQLGVPVLYGDAANSEILNHAALDRARVLIVTIPNETSARIIVAVARKQSASLQIVTRAATWAGVGELRAAGANDIVWPELEGGVEIVRRTLLGLDLPLDDVQRYTDAARAEGLGRYAASDNRIAVG